MHGQREAATFAKSFKEAQGDLSLLMMVQMIPGFLTTLYPMASKTWVHFVAWVGQQALITDVLGGKAPSMLFFVAAALNLVIAAVAVQGTAALLHREKIIFGR